MKHNLHFFRIAAYYLLVGIQPVLIEAEVKILIGRYKICSLEYLAQTFIGRFNSSKIFKHIAFDKSADIHGEVDIFSAEILINIINQAVDGILDVLNILGTSAAAADEQTLFKLPLFIGVGSHILDKLMEPCHSLLRSLSRRRHI